MKSLKFLVFTFLAFLISFLISFTLNRTFYGEKDVEQFQKKLDEKYIQLDALSERFFEPIKPDFNENLEKKGFIILKYSDDTLSYWSDNSVSVPKVHNDTIFSNRFAFFGNKWVIVKEYSKENDRIIGLIPVKIQNPYQNEFLRNRFSESFNLPESADILLDEDDQSFSLYDWDNDYIFSIRFNGATKLQLFKGQLIAVFFYAGIFFLLLFLYTAIESITPGTRKNLLIIAVAFLLVFLRVLLILFSFPAFLHSLELFNPLIYAYSAAVPSLGDLLINSVILFFIILLCKKQFIIREDFLSSKKSIVFPIVSLLLVISTGFFFYIFDTFRSLILDSSISFELYKATELSVYSFLALFIVLLNFISLFLLFDKVYTLAKTFYKLEIIILIFTTILALGVVICYLFGFNIDSISILFYFLLFIIFGIFKLKKENVYGYSTLVLLGLFLSVYTIYFISYSVHQKKHQTQKVLAVNLANEHDPIAEYLFEEISRELQNDSLIIEMLTDYSYTIDDIYAYLRKNYFTGFWNKYNISQITVCTPNDSVYIPPPNEDVRHCYSFFEDIAQLMGVLLPNSNFYYMDNANGRISYFGKFEFKKDTSQNEIALFIELDSRLISLDPGFPELLLDERLMREAVIKDYSYAKYYKKELIAQNGDFHYSLTPDIYGTFDEPFSEFVFNNYDHIIYNVSPDNIIIISSRSVRIFDYLISFSYIFVFYYLLIAAYLLLVNLSFIEKGIEFNFKNKIQFSIITILLISLILIGGGTIYFSIQQYRQNQYNNLSEKMQSVYVELEHKLAYEKSLSPYWSATGYDNLNMLLIKFSNVFYTDINLYTADGELLATSREEIFNMGLQGNRMNYEAYIKISDEQQAQYVHNEKIGNLKFLSGYVPFLNYDNKLLAYLNLPYFTKHAQLQKDLAALVVAIVNIYILLILLTVAIAIFISDEITKPLRLIQQKFAGIELGKKYERINYKGKDEIGSLVREYNRIVVELEQSVELLAKSERESAWREMAKQIAHEIKNPLTPMKLSVQHLRRSWNDKSENYTEYLERVTATLIEQIDNLSTIASEFSNFAKMPKANLQKVNLVDKINSSVQLFSNTKNISIKTDFHGIETLNIYADKEQLLRVFNNLLKNAIQSIPEHKQGKLMVELNLADNRAIIKIADNGKGIPEDQQDKLFMPSFTTKSSGMGLGLAISKNIIQNIKGSITFETIVGKGTTFIIDLPVYNQE
ncbi:MAG: GHKL domain-containing protein [Bacteroidales bacterium]|nr:GHKL domain-containing protein [Bacteroidales bacterium]